MITPQDEAAYKRWLYSGMTLAEAFALYRMELLNISLDSECENDYTDESKGEISND